MPTNQEQAESPGLQPLDLQRIANALATASVGHTLDYHRSVPSTMPLAHALAARPEIRAGTLVVAEEQSAGRGRRARLWHAPPGTSLLVSVVVKPPLLTPTPAAAAQLSMVSAVAVVEAVSVIAPEAALGLKWPNDVLITLRDGTPGKLAGILVEAAYYDSTPAHAILGIGINVNQGLHQFPPFPANAPPPASLYTALGQATDRTALLIELCRALAARLDEEHPSATLFARWREKLITLGRRVTVYATGYESGSGVTGVALDVEPDGALVVRDDAGARHRFHAGDATLRA